MLYREQSMANHLEWYTERLYQCRAYASEIAPAPLRGFLVGTLQPFLNFGSLLACIVNYFCAKSTTRTGWMVATGLQGITAVLVLALLPFTPGQLIFSTSLYGSC